MLEISSQHSHHRGSLTAKLEGQVVGHIDFVPLSSLVIDLVHTKVIPEFEGRGYGRELVEAAVEFARSEGLQLAASCPFAARMLDKKPEWADVWTRQ